MKNRTPNNSVQKTQRNKNNGPTKNNNIQKNKSKVLPKLANNSIAQNQKVIVDPKLNMRNVNGPKNVLPQKQVIPKNTSIPSTTPKTIVNNNMAPKKDVVPQKPHQEGDGLNTATRTPQAVGPKLVTNADSKKPQEALKNNQTSNNKQNSNTASKKAVDTPKKPIENNDNNSTKESCKPCTTLDKEKRKEESLSLDKVANDMVKVLAELRNSINLMKTSANRESYSDVVPQLEQMCQQNEAIFHKPVVKKSGHNNNNNNENTNKNQSKPQKQPIVNNKNNNLNAVTTSNASVYNTKQIAQQPRPKTSNISNKTLSSKISRKSNRELIGSRESYNPLGVIKDEVDQAIKKRKIFSIRGHYPAVRKSLLSRGWIEKFLSKLNEEQKKYQSYSISELVELLRHKEIYDVCRKAIKSKLLQNHQVDLFWDHCYDAFKECSDNVKLTLINKFRRDVFSYTSKQGLCEAVKDSYWFQIPGVSNINHPRSYTLSKKGDTKGFIRDFNLTAAMSLLKWIVKNSVTNECKILSESGKIPMKVFSFAVTECYKFLKQLNHEDIDNVIEDALDYDWHEFLEYFYKTVHIGNHFKSEAGASECDMVNKAKFLLDHLKEKWLYLEMDGMMNIWILKPTNGSRGIGIHICRTLEYVLNTVKKNPNRRYIIQKYIERPFLIHDTKFDIRQWFLISSSNPLTIWMYKMCYLRFSSETYNLRKLHESIHLTNNSVQCRYQKNVKKTIILPIYNMWDSKQFKAYLSDIGYPKVYQNIIYPGMTQSITAAVLMHQEKIDKRKNCFELYGADFILTEDFKPWLLEINSNPALHSSTPVTSRMCPQVLEDVVKVVVDFERNPKADTGNFELIYKQTVIAQPELKGTLQLSGEPIEEAYFYNEPTSTDQQKSLIPIKNKISWSDLSKHLDPSCNLKMVGETVRKTLESLIKLLKNEKLKRQQRKSKSVETRSLCCVLEKTHNGTQTALLEQLFEDFLNEKGPGPKAADESRNFKVESTMVNTLPVPYCQSGQEQDNIVLEEVNGMSDNF